MSEEEWGPWIDHDGKGCPVPVGTIVEAEFLGGKLKSGSVTMKDASWLYGSIFKKNSWSIVNGRYCRPIIMYRVKKPKGLQILESLLQNLDDKININRPLEIQT